MVFLSLVVFVVVAGMLVSSRVSRMRQSRREAELRRGLVPREQLVLPGDVPSAELAAVLDAARTGDWRPVAGYLAEAGSDGDANRRWMRMEPLGAAAVAEDHWLRLWREEEPRSAVAVLLQTDALVQRAWEIRTGRYASEVTTEQARGFHQVLREAERVAQEAVQLAPAEDPNPWVAQIAIAMGLGWSHEDFRALWAEVVARDPHHLRAHEGALQYWCAKWHGSHELMHAFVDTALADAPAGSLLTTLRVRASYEQITRDKAGAAAYRTPEFTAAVDALLADLAQADPAHPQLQAARGWAAWALVMNARVAQALELFHVMGREVAGPWRNYDEPQKAFDRMREICVQAIARAKA
ncbi:DUF4034 domain-containing protein [Streptomyces kaniharaensis]|uniref:DUF4034 domain-containing protein n=1 Tax=Streptomyces kaniharaensis TaxID=212423 RepID=A0A6N7L369_9ACTN|nr:DUF4034 domain-containing protein [Streptomyces kaniharaensis]MQS16584.1 DUF4034 domain-containing protein [Streptomyces kaniharaensis]